MTPPPKPPSRSASAHAAAAAPPPTMSAPTVRSDTGAVRDEEPRDVVLEAGIEDDEHLVARLDDAGGRGNEARPVAEDRDHERPVRQREVGDALARGRAPLAHDELDDLEPLLGQVEQVHQPVA